LFIPHPSSLIPAGRGGRAPAGKRSITPSLSTWAEGDRWISPPRISGFYRNPCPGMPAPRTSGSSGGASRRLTRTHPAGRPPPGPRVRTCSVQPAPRDRRPGNGPSAVDSKLQSGRPGIRGLVPPAHAVSEKVPGTVRYNHSGHFLGRPFGGVDLLQGDDDHHGRDQAQAHTRSSQAEVVRPPSPTAIRPVPGVPPGRSGGESCDSEPKGLTVHRFLTLFGALGPQPTNSRSPSPCLAGDFRVKPVFLIDLTPNTS
jgi:hypothetical protein